MTNLNIKSKEPKTLSEVKKILNEVEEERELNFRSSKTMDYVNRFVNLSLDEVNKLKEEIKGLEILRLKDEHIAKIIDFMPESVDEFKLIFQGSYVTFSEDDIESIVKVIDEFKSN
ncbi:MAG: hypothetical protein ACOCRX_07775 [Candidatus Woesearchaeota archaeon]